MIGNVRMELTSKQCANAPQHYRTLKEHLGPHEKFEERRRLDKELVLIGVEIECLDIGHKSRYH